MHSSAVRSGSVAEPATAAELVADDGIYPTLYVPNPMAGWGVPSRRAMEGQWRRACCSGVVLAEDIMALREIEYDDDVD